MLFLNMRNALAVLAASVCLASAAPSIVSAYEVAETSLTTEKIRVPINGPIDYRCDGNSTHLEIGILKDGVFRTTGYNEQTGLVTQKNMLLVCVSPSGAAQNQQAFMSAGTGFRITELSFSVDSERLTGVKVEAQQ